MRAASTAPSRRAEPVSSAIRTGRATWSSQSAEERRKMTAQRMRKSREAKGANAPLVRGARR